VNYLKYRLKIIFVICCIFTTLNATTASEIIDEYTKSNIEWAKEGITNVIKGSLSDKCIKKDSLCILKEVSSGNNYLISTNYDSWERESLLKAFKSSKDNVIIIGTQDFIINNEPLVTPNNEYVFKIHNLVTKKQKYGISDVLLKEYICGDSCYMTYVNENGNEENAISYLMMPEEQNIENYVKQTITIFWSVEDKQKIISKVWFPEPPVMEISAIEPPAMEVPSNQLARINGIGYTIVGKFKSGFCDEGNYYADFTNLEDETEMSFVGYPVCWLLHGDDNGKIGQVDEEYQITYDLDCSSGNCLYEATSVTSN
jgi:hypothetical protein